MQQGVTGGNRADIPIRIPWIIVPIHATRTHVRRRIRAIAAFNHQSVFYFNIEPRIAPASANNDSATDICFNVKHLLSFLL